MILNSKTSAMKLLRAVLIAVALNFFGVSDSAANIQFSIDNVTVLAKKLAAERYLTMAAFPHPGRACYAASHQEFGVCSSEAAPE
jgi:hypothetical protein